MWLNVVPLLTVDHADIHLQASVFVRDKQVQNASQCMLNFRKLDINYFLCPDSQKIRLLFYKNLKNTPEEEGQIKQREECKKNKDSS
mmetsp:Transcript_20720/g.25504  ORF Transcript_20720/g.25504 Transcript_20720/m.25504 type:complete len:87 (-) Transcript_20720:391-651(-)